MHRFVILILILLTLLITSTALSADDKKPRNEVTLKDLRERTFVIQKEILPESALKRSVTGYQEYLDSPLGGAMRREALRRIADRMQQQIEAEEDQFVSDDEPPATEEALLKDVSYEKVLKYYNEALDNYPDFPGNEHILYQMARAYEANGEPKQAIWALKRLLKVDAEKDYIHEAHFRIAELSFLTRQFTKAVEHYNHLIKLEEETQFYRIALYKSSWASFKKKDYDAALNQMIALLDYMIAEDTSLEDMVSELPQYSISEREMIKDTLRVMSIAFTHQEEPLLYMKSFLATLEEPREYTFMIFQALGDMYHYQELYQDAASVYATFAEIYSQHAQAPFFQIMAIETYHRGRFSELKDKAIRYFAGNFGYQTHFWKTEQPAILKQQLEPYLRQHLSNLAKQHHAELQKKASENNKQQALYWYRSYLDSFAKDHDAAHINFLLAELLFETGDYKIAALEYNKAAYSYGMHKESQEAGYAAILAYAKHKATLKGDELIKWRRQSVENALHFAKVYSQDERVPSIVTKTAQDLFDVGAFDTAIKAASIVLSLRSINEERQKSAHLVMGHSFFEKTDFHRAEGSYKSALKLMKKSDRDHSGTYERVAASIYKQAEHQQNKNNLRAAIHEYLRLVKTTPLSNIRDTAEFDAATTMLRMKNWQDAIDILVKMRKTIFGKKHATEINQKLTVAYLETNQNEMAAAELEELSQLGSNYEIQREAIWRAAELYEKAGNPAATIKAFESYVKRYPTPIDANIEARYKLAGLYNEQDNHKLYIARLNDVIVQDEKAQQQSTPRTKYLAGISALALADMAYQEYQDIRLVEPIKTNLRLKKNQMKKVIKDYGNVASYGIAELITNGTFKIAEIYRDFAKALMASERPGQLDDDELEMYEIMLEEQAFPFEEKAIDLHEKNYKRMQDGIFDQWVKNSLGILSTINPGRYDKSENKVDYIEIFN